MRTSYLAEKSSSNFGHRSPGLTLVALLLSLAATQACGMASSQTLSQSQNQPASGTKNEIKITADLGQAIRGTSYLGTLSATGGKRPYEFSVISGTLPAGLVLHPETGAITGTPSKVETSNFEIRVQTAGKQHHADLGMRLTVANKQSSLTVTVTPATAAVASAGAQQLTASVTAGNSGTTTAASTVSQQVRWSASAGTVSTSGMFTAPTTSVAIAATVTATSVADPTASASAVISVTPASSRTTVTVTPATATVPSAGTQQLTASVSTGNSATTTAASTISQQVRWSASAGTVSTSGLFTAPTTSVATSATVTATSVADSTASASAIISVTAGGSTTLSISTTALPNATQGSSYADGLSASGGTLPYAWSVSSGSLPAGLSLSAAGAFSGSPTKTGTSSFTIKVTDAASHSATASLALTVDAANTNGKFDGPAELPRAYVQSALANTPANGKTWQASDTTSLQSALNAAACGDTIKLQAGATFSGTFAFPGKSCDDQHWIIVRTSSPDSSLPAEGTRITPCYAGVASLPARPALNCASTTNVMAKLEIAQIAGSGPVTFLAGANHYRLIGLEITRPANGAHIGALVFPANGATGDRIIFDRVWIHGTAHDETTRGIHLSGLTNVAVVDSYLNDFHCEARTGACTDAQTILGGLGSTPGGPYKIVNNFLESSGEIILFGGGGATVSPADIEVRHNHFFKPTVWMVGTPGFVGGNHGNPFIVKNFFELKNAQRVLFEGNVAENTWGGYSQTGFGIVLTPKNQGTPNGPVCPNCQVTDVTIRFSTFSHVGGGFQIANTQGRYGGPSFAGTRYSIHDVVVDDVRTTAYAGLGQLAQVSSSPNNPLLADVQLNHITAFPSNIIFDIGNPTTGPKIPNFLFTNSIVTAGKSPVWGIGGGAANCAYDVSVPANLLGNCFAPYAFTSNALIAVPSRWPASTWPAGNTLMTDPTSVGFVNFNNGNGGDYHLKPGSACKNAGSDGKDLGADMTALGAAIAGAY